MSAPDPTGEGERWLRQPAEDLALGPEQSRDALAMCAAVLTEVQSRMT